MRDGLDSKVDQEVYDAEVNELKELINKLLSKGGDIPTIDISSGSAALKAQVEKLLERIKELERRVEMNEGDLKNHDKQIEEIFKILESKADLSDLKKLQDDLAKLM